MSKEDSEPGLNEQLFDIDIWGKDQTNQKNEKEKEKEDSKKDSDKSEESFLNFNNNDNLDNFLPPSSSIPLPFYPKLSFSRQQNKTLGLLNKKFDDNNFNCPNNINNTNNHNIPNLSKLTQNKKEDLLAKVTEQVSKNYPKDIPFNKPLLFNKLNNNSENKNSTEQNAHKSSYQEDEKEKCSNNNKLSLNKVDSIQIYNNNIIPRHNYTGRNYTYNNNNIANMNSESPKCYATNDHNYWKQGIYPIYINCYLPYKSSFLSTDPNSFNQSGQKMDSPLSTQSGQYSHRDYDNHHSVHYNNTMNGWRNRNLVTPFGTNNTPEGNKNILLNTFNYNSNQPMYKHCKTEYNKMNNNNLKQTSERQIINLENVALGKENRTTIMMRNIPIKYDTTVLLEELKPFEGKFNCIYIPYDYQKDGNRGYAFINLTNPYHILLFYDYFYNKSWLFFQSLKVCDLDYAKSQGIEEITNKAWNYRGNIKQIFYMCSNDKIDNTIEIPNKYFDLVLKANPKMKYHEGKFKNTFIVDAFN